jgi:hypothetical protein
MFESNRLRPHFVRGITRTKLPVGRVFQDPTTKQESYLAEIEEAYVIRIYDPEAEREREIVIDPRHAQARDQIKLAQDVLEGRVGGLTPLRMEIEKASALDPQGNEVPGTEIMRVAEIENPALTRGQAKVLVDGHPIGEWTPEVDSEVDRSCSFDVARRFAGFMADLADDEQKAEWNAVAAAGRAHLAGHLKAQGLDEIGVEREIDRHAVSREDFLRGIHVDSSSGAATAQSVWDPLRSPVPKTTGEQADYFIQRALIERFQRSMRAVETVNSKGEAVFANIITVNEAKLIALEALPAGKPRRDPEVTAQTCDEKSRQIATHLLGGYMLAQGARVRDRFLGAELEAEWRLHADTMATLKAANVPPSEIGAMYFKATQARSLAYGEDSRLKVEKHARAAMKFPSHEDKGPSDDAVWSKRSSEALDKTMKLGEEAGHGIENITFGL